MTDTIPNLASEASLARAGDVLRAGLGDAASPAVHRRERERLLARLVGERPRRRLVPALAMFAGAAVAAAVVAVALRPAPLTYVSLPASASQQGALRFSDGTEMRLGPGADARVAAVGAAGAQLVLAEGEAHLVVTPRPRGSWSVAAGPFTVRVRGTVFDVRWSARRGELEVRLHRGAVTVSGPFGADEIRLAPGQRLRALASGQAPQVLSLAAPPALTAVPTPPASELAAAPAPATAPSLPASDLARRPVPPEAPARSEASRSGAAVPAPRAAAAPKPAAKVQSAVPDERWPSLVAAGQFGAVLDGAQGLGLDRCFATCSGEGLAALADAARYAGRNQMAASALAAQRRRFAGTDGARTAAFLLGRIAEGRNDQEALRWFERYLAEAPSGVYAADALGRQMFLLRKVGDAERAQEVARTYLDRHPNGTYAGTARELLRAR